MKLVLKRDACGNGRTCPNINTTDQGSYVVQGYVPACDQPASSEEAIVEVPMSMLPELAGLPDREGLRFTDRGTVLVQGRQVTDPEALNELNLPAGENAVEIPLSVLTELEVACA